MACACEAETPFAGIEADFLREVELFRIVVVFLMQELCGNSRETTIASLHFTCRPATDLRKIQISTQAGTTRRLMSTACGE